MKSPASSHILSEKEVFEKLQGIGEGALLRHWNELNNTQKENLRRQITHLNVIFFHRQQEELFHPHNQQIPFEPFTTSFSSGNQADSERGQKALKEGKCASIILAGGQGSRLRCKGPKGCVPFTGVKQKTLFQFLAEKIKAASAQANRPLQVAIMTSPLNHVETEFYFVQNAFFGLDPRQVTFFYQRMWPLLDLDGHLFLEAPDQLAYGPNGNGGVFRRLVEVGLWKKWQEKGIEMVNVLPIDNPLALPFDPELFGFQQRLQCEVVLKASKRRDAQEKVGIVVKVEGKPKILEYSEFTKEQSKELEEPIANLGLYSFSMPFIKRVSQEMLPIHLAKKVAKERGEFPDVPNAWKFEEFIFDVLPFTHSCEVLLYPRQHCFAPLKNLKGEDSIETARAALQALDREIYTRVTGERPSEKAVFELSSSFYYPTESLLKRWKGKPLPDRDYIEDKE